MKIDFYDLFSLHTPTDFPEAGGEQYITAAVRSRVMENISADKRKRVRAGRLSRSVLTAAAAVVVLVTGTLAASALGLIDLEKAFGHFFNGGTEHMEGISAVPQNVITTGDDRLSLSVVGIGGTENEALVTIEIKRNDGGTFPESIYMGEADINTEKLKITYIGQPNVEDDTAAIMNFSVSSKYGEKIVGNYCEIKFKDIYDFSNNIYPVPEENIILKGEWSISFPLEYEYEYRTKEIKERIVESKMASPAIMTEIGYSSISLDIYFDSVYEAYGTMLFKDISINLDNGERVGITSGGSDHVYGDRYSVGHYFFEKPVDIDSIESITVKDVEIQIK